MLHTSRFPDATSSSDVSSDSSSFLDGVISVRLLFMPSNADMIFILFN